MFHAASKLAQQRSQGSDDRRATPGHSLASKAGAHGDEAEQHPGRPISPGDGVPRSRSSLTAIERHRSRPRARAIVLLVPCRSRRVPCGPTRRDS
jgi:hypothetical protein